MVVKDFVHHAAVAYAYTRTAYLILYLDSFEIFSITGLLSMYLLYENVRMNLLRSKKKTNSINTVNTTGCNDDNEIIDKNIFQSCMMHSFLSVLTLLYAFTQSPTHRSVELARINSLLCLNEDFDLLKSMDFGINDLVLEMKVHSLRYLRVIRQKFRPN